MESGEGEHLHKGEAPFNYLNSLTLKFNCGKIQIPNLGSDQTWILRSYLWTKGGWRRKLPLEKPKINETRPY